MAQLDVPFSKQPARIAAALGSQNFRVVKTTGAYWRLVLEDVQQAAADAALENYSPVKTAEETQAEEIAELHSMLGGLAKLQVRLIQYLMARTVWKKPEAVDFSPEDLALFNRAKTLVDKIDGI